VSPVVEQSAIASTLSAWSAELKARPAEGGHWLTYWSRLNETLKGSSDASAEFYNGIISEALSERLLIHFLELKGIRVARLARVNYVFRHLLTQGFKTQVTAILAEEISELFSETDLVSPEVLNVDDDTFLAVGPEYAIVTSGGNRRYFPCVDEAVASPKHGPVLIDNLAGKIGEALRHMEDVGTPITRLCFIEKSFGPVGLISVASDLVRRFDLPALNYRSYAWNARDVRVSSGRPGEGERLCAVYDVAVSGSMLQHTASYLKRHYKAELSAAVVYYDLEEGARDTLKRENVSLFSVRTKRDFLTPLAERYRDVFGEPLEEPSTDVQINPDLKRRVDAALAAPEHSEDNAIIEAFESYVRTNAKELQDDRLAAGTRVLTWQDVAQEMRQRTPFGKRYLKALAQGTVESLLRQGKSETRRRPPLR
jgi:hypothetical protein